MKNAAIKTAALDQTHLYQYVLFALAVAALCVACATPVFAATGGLTDLCGVISANMGSGKVGPAVASIAVIGLGVGASLGKVSWTSAVVVAVGIAVIFGYPTIVSDLSGGTSGCTT